MSDLEKRQAAAKRAHDKMLEMLLRFTPCDKLTVADVKFIAEYCRTCAFDATEEVLP